MALIRQSIPSRRQYADPFFRERGFALLTILTQALPGSPFSRSMHKKQQKAIPIKGTPSGK
ncbi:MAG: hypothetical protein ACLT8C_08145 [Akkermansia muciniphila]